MFDWSRIAGSSRDWCLLGPHFILKSLGPCFLFCRAWKGNTPFPWSLLSSFDVYHTFMIHNLCYIYWLFNRNMYTKFNLTWNHKKKWSHQDVCLLWLNIEGVTGLFCVAKYAWWLVTSRELFRSLCFPFWTRIPAHYIWFVISGVSVECVFWWVANHECKMWIKAIRTCAWSDLNTVKSLVCWPRYNRSLSHHSWVAL